MKRIVQQVIVLLTLCWMMPSCSDETFNYESGEGTGYLCLTLGKVDVEFSSSTRAETVSLPDELIPAAADFMVDIQKDGISVEGFPKKYSEINSLLELAVGSYIVNVYHGENELLQKVPYFFGTSSTIQVFPGKQKDITVNATMTNAMLVPKVSENLQKHYKTWKLTVKVGDKSMILADENDSDGYLFAQAGKSVNVLFEGTNLLEQETMQAWNIAPSAEARTKYVIQCDPDLSVFSNIQLTATATHTYTEEILTGTDVVLNINSNGAPLELIDSWDIKLSYNGTPIRTYTAKPENGILMTVTDGWPYVPQGSTFSASIHLQTGETFDLSSSILNEIPLPEFTTTVFGNTSYSVYKNSGAETANTKDGSSIFDINAEPSIDSKILNNPNYSNILNVKYKTDSGKNSRVLPYGEVVQFDSLAWQQHNLSAIVSFDGVKKESSQLACHVTGLPYVPSAMIQADWGLTNNCEYNNGVIQLGGGTGNATATSKMVFHIPENIGVRLNTNVTLRAYQLVFWYNTTYTIKVNETTVISQDSNDIKEKNYSLSGTGTFSSGACQVKLNSSRETINVWSKVHTLQILYN